MAVISYPGIRPVRTTVHVKKSPFSGQLFVCWSFLLSISGRPVSPEATGAMLVSGLVKRRESVQKNPTRCGEENSNKCV